MNGQLEIPSIVIDWFETLDAALRKVRGFPTVTSKSVSERSLGFWFTSKEVMISIDDVGEEVDNTEDKISAEFKDLFLDLKWEDLEVYEDTPSSCSGLKVSNTILIFFVVR